jgi:hypothetical protein
MPIAKERLNSARCGAFTASVILKKARRIKAEQVPVKAKVVDGFNFHSESSSGGMYKSHTAIPNGAIRSAMKIPAIAKATNENTPSGFTVPPKLLNGMKVISAVIENFDES